MLLKSFFLTFHSWFKRCFNIYMRHKHTNVALCAMGNVVVVLLLNPTEDQSTIVIVSMPRWKEMVNVIVSPKRRTWFVRALAVVYVFRRRIIDHRSNLHLYKAVVVDQQATKHMTFFILFYYINESSASWFIRTKMVALLIHSTEIFIWLMRRWIVQTNG